MKKIVLLGSAHPVQRGQSGPGLFRSVLVEQYNFHQINGIAEEIEKGAVTVASQLSAALKLRYLYADPDGRERAERGIQSDCRHDLIREYAERYPGLRAWPREEDEETLPVEVLQQYRKRTEVANRMRESIWMEKILEFDVWPLLFIAGADHFEPFGRLIEASGYDLIKSHPDWPEIILLET